MLRPSLPQVNSKCGMGSLDRIAGRRNHEPRAVHPLPIGNAGLLLIVDIIVQGPAVVSDLRLSVGANRGADLGWIEPAADARVAQGCQEWRPGCGTLTVAARSIGGVLGEEVERQAVAIRQDGAVLDVDGNA